jgi:hypothetical protein
VRDAKSGLPFSLSRMALRATKIHENPGLWRTSGEQAQGFSTLPPGFRPAHSSFYIFVQLGWARW